MNNEIVTQKKCTTCKEVKLLSEFNKFKHSFDGLKCECRDCSRNRAILFYRSKVGVVAKIYSHQKQSAKHRNMLLPTYSEKELKDWLFAHDLFHILYDHWVDSNYKREQVPSVDRIDDYKSYTMNNVQVMTWLENKNKYHLDQRNGINNKNNKAVIQLDLDGNFIAKFHSTYDVERKLGLHNSNIGRVCKHERKTAGGFRWQYVV